MAESSSPQKPLQPPITTGDSIPSVGTPNPNLTSPQVHTSPSMDLPQISSPQLPQPQPMTSGAATAVDYVPKQQMQQLQASMQQLQQNQQMNTASNFQVQAAVQRSGGSMPRISQLQQQFGTAAAANAMRQHTGGIYGVQMSFAGQQFQQQAQQIGGAARQGMIAQAGQLSMIPGQSVNLQAQMLAQNRQKMNLVTGSQFLPANSSGTGLQGMQAMGLIGSLGMNAQLRANNPLNYSQQRFGQAQIRQQSLPQQIPLTSPQKLSGQNMSRSTSLATNMNPQLPSLVQNGQALVQNAGGQQQWLKQMQSGISGPISPSYNIQQQQQQQKQQTNFLPQQTSSSPMHLKQMGLNQQQLSQLVQQQNQPLLSNQQQRQQLEQLQQLQQQQQLQQASPRLSGNALQKSLSLSGSDKNTTAANAATPSGSSGHATESSSQLLGKRKIEDLVSQVDSRAKLDPEVVDLLLEMADDFIDSVTTFACSLARHRKSSLLEAKDVLLHLEKNWQLKIPGFSSAETHDQRKCMSSDIHNKRLEMIRTLMESQLAETDLGPKAPTKQTMNESSVNHPMKPSPSSEQLVFPASSTQILNKIPRF